MPTQQDREPGRRGGDDRPSIRARTLAASAILAVVLLLILADGLDTLICGCQIDFPKSAIGLLPIAAYFWFGVRLSEWVHLRVGGRDDDDHNRPGRPPDGPTGGVT